MDSPPLGLELFDRMERALRLVRERRARATAALGRAGIAYALAGGNAVAAWVRSVDPSAERNTPDVAIAIRQTDADRADAALREVGFHRIVPDRLDLFFDELPAPDTSLPLLVRKAVRLIYREESTGEPVQRFGYPVLPIGALLQTELAGGRALNRLNVRDLIDVGLVDASWCDRLPPVLADRLRELLADPDG